MMKALVFLIALALSAYGTRTRKPAASPAFASEIAFRARMAYWDRVKLGLSELP